MTRFRRLTHAPDATFRDEWNRLVETVEALLRMSTAAGIELSWASGTPCLRLDPARLVRATQRARLTEDLAIGGSAAAVLLVADGAGGWDDGDEIEVTDWGLDWPLPSGTKLIVDYHAGADEWHVLQAQFTPLTVVTQFCCQDDQATVCDRDLRLPMQVEDEEACECEE